MERSTYWDSLKAVLISLVVLGHTGTALGDNILSVIYAFHMPLFMLVSGFFTRKKSTQIFSGGICKLLIIYALFQCAYVTLDFFTGVPVDVNRMLTPSFALWYILALIYYRVLFQFIPNFLIKHKAILILLSFAIAIGAGFIPLDSQLAFQRSCTFLPFFVIGYYVNREGCLSKIRNINKIMATFCLIACAILCYYVMPVFYGTNYYALHFDDTVMRTLHLCIALLMCISIMALIPEKLGRFTDIGRYTLMIYIIHPPFIKIGKMLCAKIGFDIGIGGALMLTAMTIYVIYIMRNFKILQYLK